MYSNKINNAYWQISNSYRFTWQHKAFATKLYTLDETLIAEKLRESGYKTHLVGKWHAGFYKKECIPTYRGFDSFFVYLTGSEDYYTHVSSEVFSSQPYRLFLGYDLRRNESVSTKEKGEYSTFMFTKEAQKLIMDHDSSSPMYLYLAFQAVHSPLQVPQQYIKQYEGIIKDSRRTYHNRRTYMPAWYQLWTRL